MRGYATLAERHGKAVRAQVLRARLAAAERRLAAGRVPVARGGRGLPTPSLSNSLETQE